MATIKALVDSGTLTITVEGYAPIVIDPAALPADLVAQAALHGFKQKYVDKAALGAGATAQAKYDAISGLVAHHAATGEWNMGPGGDGASSDGLLVRALVEITGADIDAVRETVAGLDKKGQAALRGSPDVAPVIARLKLARGPKADTGAAAAAASVMLRLTQRA